MTEFKWDDCYVKELLRKVTSFNSTDHWQKEIDAFKASKQPKPDWEIVNMRKDGSLHPYQPVKCHDGTCTIYSVRRLSDGEVFAIIDRVHNENYTELIDHWEMRDGYPIACFKEQPPVSILNLVKAVGITFEQGLTKDWEAHMENLRHNLSENRPRFTAQPKYQSEHTIPPAANGKVPVWLTPEQEGKLGRLLALFNDPMAGAVSNKTP